MGKRDDIKKVLVIGSGPIVIGQAAEFDYAGTQACKSLKEEGYEVVLINSNPATIMTDTTIADKVYMEPLTFDFVLNVIRKERPCGVLLGFGGQTGLNIAVELNDKKVFERYNIQVLGTSVDSIKKAEDRDLFRILMKEINEPICESIVVNNCEDALEFSKSIGYPIIVRPAYTLGGTGGGIANNEEELYEIVKNGLYYSPVNQCLIERSIAGFKEIEYEVMRDKNDNCIVVCNMENLDPVGVHTGDSIVVAPSQTLTDKEYQFLRDSSLKIIRALGIEGGCNVQFALDPNSFKYYVIEVNPRVSRSSALASKATGYPIAKIAAKICIGMTLDEIINPVTKTTYACFEPSLDYIVTKIPRFPFDKFEFADRSLSTQMKATGEVMAIGRNFEESFLKAIRSLEIKVYHVHIKKFDDFSNEAIKDRLKNVDDERIFVLAEALRRGFSIEDIHCLTKIDRFFINKIKNIIDIENEIKNNKLDLEILKYAKSNGFSDEFLSSILNISKEEIEKIRYDNAIVPVYKMVDTCACEFDSNTPYFYSSYEEENESIISDKKKIIVLGSGPIRIGQGIEFDYSSVHSILAIKELGYEAIMINNNPETVSTDFEISDKLYFEPLTIEDIMHIINHEKPHGVIVQFGGQTSINLSDELVKRGVNILGTKICDIKRSEDRDLFDNVLEELSIKRPKGKSVLTIEDGVKIGEKLGFPVLVRPSYVLGGQAMEIVYDKIQLEKYMKKAISLMPNTPILVDKYLKGIEAEVDAICDGEHVFIPGILEHIERAGVHSGDSMGVYPSKRLGIDVKNKIIDIARRLCLSLNIVGLLNIQFIIEEDEVYVIEVNPRSSRTVPFISKVTGVPVPNLATRVILGKKLKQEGYIENYQKEGSTFYVKSPVFSFSKLKGVDVKLGPEMKSTGEAIGVSNTLEKALYKAFISSGIKIETHGSILFTIADKDKKESMPLAEKFIELGFEIYGTRGTAKYFKDHGINVKNANKLDESDKTILDLIYNKKINFIVNTVSNNKKSQSEFQSIRSVGVERGVLCLTSLDTVKALLDVIDMISFTSFEMPSLNFRNN